MGFLDRALKMLTFLRRKTIRPPQTVGKSFTLHFKVALAHYPTKICTIMEEKIREKLPKSYKKIFLVKKL